MLSAVPSILPAVMRMIGCEELLAWPEWATVEAMLLADWGAEVIRIESLQHCAMGNTRGYLARPPPAFVESTLNGGVGYPDDEPGERPWNRSAIFNHHGRNKLSMTVHLTRQEGRDVLQRLVAISDGLIENNLPENIETHGITWEALSSINPKLVLVRMPAFGLDGPYRGYRTLGNQMESLAGHPLIRSYPQLSLDYAPANVTPDASAGVAGALAFLLGLRQRRKTGQGLQAEAATTENFVPLLGEFVIDYSMNQRLWGRMGNDHFWLAPHNVYRCQGEDRWVAIAVRSEEEWRAPCRVMARLELADDPRVADMASRHRGRRELDGIIGEWTAIRDAWWVTDRLQRAGVPAGVVMHESDAIENRHLEERHFWQDLTHPEAGTHRYARTAWLASETQGELRRAAPRLGEDNEYVYRELLECSTEEYARFEDLGNIGMDYDPSVP